MYTQLSSILTFQGHSQSADIVNHAAVAVVGLGHIEPPKRCTVDVFNILPYLCLLDSPCIHHFFLSLANSFFPLLCSLNRCLLVLLCSNMITWRQLQFQSYSSPVFSGVYACNNLYAMMPTPRAICPCQLTTLAIICAKVLSNTITSMTSCHKNLILQLCIWSTLASHLEMAPAILKCYM